VSPDSSPIPHGTRAPREPSVTLRPILVLVAITAVWGATFVTVKDALQASDTFTFLALRFGLGGLFGVVLAGRALWNPHVWRRGLILGVLLFGGYALQTAGLETTSPARSAFLTGLSVLLVPFAEVFVARRYPRATTLAGAAIALGGLQVLTGFRWGESPPIGDVLTMACAAVYALHISVTSHLGPGTSPMALVTVQLLVTAALATLSIPLVEHRLALTPDYLFAVFITGIVASTLAIALQIWAQSRVDASRAAVIYALEPAFAIAWGVAMGFGWPAPREWLGGTLIMAAVLLSELGPRCFPSGRVDFPRA
jgi:drug/metabolite transporter (DMT)-like permease